MVDPRGQRLAAALTTVLFVVVLLTGPAPLSFALLAFQVVVFGLGVGRGPASTPYSWVFRTLVRPRLGAPAELEDERPPRFAQGVGLVFAAVALIGYAAGVTLLGDIAAGFALAAAFLNAAFGYCLGCEVYLLLTRVRSARIPSTATTTRAGTDPVLER